MQPTLIVGDVHGCIAELDALLARARGRRVVFVGDLVAKGPDSREVVRRARALNAEAVKGNHDEHVLRWYRASKAERKKLELKPEHQQVVDTLGDAEWQWLAARPTYLRLGGDVLVVHGGLVPGVPLDAQREEDLINMRSVDERGKPSKKIEGFTPWAKAWRGPEFVVFGHDAVRGLQREKFALGLDTGCVYGGELTGVLMPERELVSVKAKKPYAEMKAKK